MGPKSEAWGPPQVVTRMMNTALNGEKNSYMKDMTGANGRIFNTCT